MRFSRSPTLSLELEFDWFELVGKLRVSERTLQLAKAEVTRASQFTRLAEPNPVFSTPLGKKSRTPKKPRTAL